MVLPDARRIVPRVASGIGFAPFRSVSSPSEQSRNPGLWQRLEEQALWTLEHADQLPPRELTNGMALQLRLWRYPRSGAHASWNLILPVRDVRARRAVVREVVWDRIADWELRMAPRETLKRRQIQVPTIRSRDAEIAWEELMPYLDMVGRLRSPMPILAAATPSTRDAFGLEGYRSMGHLRLQWHGRGPRGWGDTIAWIGRLRRLLVGSMREREPEAKRD
jgi:hypothetical protein